MCVCVCVCVCVRVCVNLPAHEHVPITTKNIKVIITYTKQLQNSNNYTIEISMFLIYEEKFK